jgi:hypothetical protein
MNKSEFPCVLCASPLLVRRDKHGKPYFVCDPCGMQLFIRREEGRLRLEAAMAELGKVPKSAQQRPAALLRIRHLLAEIQELAVEIKRLEDRAGFWGDRDLERQVTALKGRKQSALAELDALCPRAPGR